MVEAEAKATPSAETTDKDVDSRHEQARNLLLGYLNKRIRVFLSDGRVIIGHFLCTDRDCNLVLGNCEEYLSKDDLAESKSDGSKHFPRQPRTVGLAIVPGHHIKNLSVAKDFPIQPASYIEPTTSSNSVSPQSSVEEPHTDAPTDT